MEKLNTSQINESLKDVRTAYRLLAVYQQRILDVVKYISNGYGLNFDSGWSKFSKAATHGNRASIDKSSWDWLSLYLYEFNLGGLKIEEEIYHFKIVHQADTGFYDVDKDKSIWKKNVEQYADVSTSQTRLIFVLSKNDNGCPIKHHLKGNLTTENNQKLVKGNWLSIPYALERFANQTVTDEVLQEFNRACIETFGVNLITV